MLKNYLITAWRNLTRNKVFSVINLTGLTLGMSVFLLIMEYVAFEWGVNRFHKNYDEIYRASAIHKDGKGDHFLPPGFGPRIKNAFPAIKYSVRIGEGIGRGLVSLNDKNASSGEKAFRDDQISYVDGDFFNVFSFPLVYGTASLHQPKTLALSQTTAVKLFGNTDPVGKTLKINNQFGQTIYTINSVFEDMPAQSDIRANILLSFSTLQNPANRNGNDWADPHGLGSGYTNIYLMLQKGTDGNLLAKQVTKFIHQLSAETKTDRAVFQPLSELHLAPSFDYPLQSFGSIRLVLSFLGVAILILLIAWINYINLSTAQGLKRIKEVGVRKTLGAGRGQLITQYLTETLLLTFTSCLTAILLAQLVQPLYNSFTGKDLSLSVLGQGFFWPVSMLLILSGSLLSGGYVAFMLSSFNPAKTIRGQVHKITGGLSLRKSLVVFQFTASVVFIIATLVLYQQMQFMQTQDLGMHIDRRLIISGPSTANTEQAKSMAFENGLKNLPFVKKYAASNNIPGQGYNFSTNYITRSNPQPGDEEKSYSMLIVDEHYFDVYDIKLKEGLNFTPQMVQAGWSGAKKVIVNEKAAAELGFEKGKPVIGQKINWGEQFEIIGVIKDYHHLSLRETIKPAIFLPAVADVYFTILTNGQNMQQKISSLKLLYTKSFPNEPFNYSFLDEVYDGQYKAEQQLGSILISSACIAVFIACLGLFGLAAFSAGQRTKEIGIRKILGASVSSIVSLLSKDFLLLVFISIMIATPIAWYAMNQWLEDFAYRITISWWIFALAGLLAVVIAFATVSFQAIKAALTNPVKSLRTE